MHELFTQSLFFGVMISLAAYELGILLRRKFHFPLFNPLLVSIVAVIVVLKCLHVDYETYNAGAKYLSYLLTPATVCLAVPLYEQLAPLKRNLKAILLGIFSGCLANALCILGLAIVFRLDHSYYVTLLPKSITTAIGMGVAEQLGGYPAIAAAVIIITGILGNAIGETVLRAFRITDPIAKGVALGTSAHAIGTVKAIEMGETEGAMSSLSIAVAGIMTVIFATVYANFL